MHRFHDEKKGMGSWVATIFAILSDVKWGKIGSLTNQPEMRVKSHYKINMPSRPENWIRKTAHISRLLINPNWSGVRVVACMKVVIRNY